MNAAEELAREVVDAFHAADIARIGTLVTEDFVDHGAPPWAPQGRAGYLQIMGFLKDVLRLRYELHEVVSDGNWSRPGPPCTACTTPATSAFPATGKPYAMPTMHLYRERNGLLAEHWGVRDELGVLWQVGALPVPEPAAL